MKKSNGRQVGVLLAAMLLVNMVFLPVVCAQGTNEPKKFHSGMTINSIEFTKDELQDLYFKYNITENDIKFAMDELPHYLEGTILVSDIGL